MQTIEETKKRYIELCLTYGRIGMLKLLRAGGITAHKLKKDRELAECLWEKFGRKKFENS